MTKKDYQAIARAIYRAGHTSTVPLCLDSVINELANVCQADNPRFNRARFIEACETGRCEGMPR